MSPRKFGFSEFYVEQNESARLRVKRELLATAHHLTFRRKETV